jgi:mono/diheme cytochrome c family protein
MSSSIVITLAVIGGIAWLGFILVAALRRRGPEEVPSNLAPGTNDEVLETRRLETSQKAAVLLSAFLAVSLPLYFLGEQQRQNDFVDQFDEESVARGEVLAGPQPEGYDCFSCHGPEGVGGAAAYVEKRSGVTVSWEAPSLNEVFYRYDDDEVAFWITYGRGNTPMPAWGLPGGGPMNEQQVQDVVNYLKTIQIPQADVVAAFDNEIRATQANRLATADETVQAALTDQLQLVADIDRSTEQQPVLDDLAQRSRELLERAGSGIDTDGDGLSDAAEIGLVEVGTELVDYLTVIDPVTLDPQNPQSVEGVDDLTTATAIVDELEALVESGSYPVLEANAAAASEAFDQGVVDPEVGISGAAAETLAGIAATVTEVDAPAEFDLASATTFVEELEAAAAAEGASPELTQAAADARAALDGGQDPDGDGLSTDAENAISTQVTSAIDATRPSEAVVPNLDPANEATSGEPDADVAASVVAGYESLALNTAITANNIEPIRAAAEQGVDFLEEALEEKRWEIDIEGVAEAAFEGDVEQAERAVYLFNGYCARCHTAGFTAGVPFTLEAGSGGFGPALWDGRPTVQFGPPAELAEDDLLIQFIINGSEAETPYGLNGFGSGRMPAFGQIMSLEDIQLLAQYLRGSDLTGMGDEEVGP